ncbi:MAG: helix-turn-helix domain-containing protein [Candidatus Cloacimonetes bacterium]|nr:helix-turn-helix domain-containing protein [Candidatus Cloacimonadota bacterium]
MEKEIAELMAIGLSENEAKTYVHLLKKQVFTASEISRLAEVNRSKVYQVLESLINKGLCIEKPGKVRKFEAVNPETAFIRLKEKQEDIVQQISNLPSLLSPIYKLQKNNSTPLDFIEVYGTPSSIINKYNKLELLSEKFVYSFSKRPYAMDDSDQVNEEQLISMSKGVIYKSIFEIEKDNLAWFIKKMKSFISIGEEIRVAYHLPIKLHIYDEKTVMFSMINKTKKEGLTYLVIEHEDLTETLINTFNFFWERALSIEDLIKREKIKE